MANFSALIASIQAYVKQNGNNDIEGNGLQQILVAMVNSIGGASNEVAADLAAEVTARGNADYNLQQSIAAEAQAREGAVNGEAYQRTQADNALQTAINAIKNNIDNGFVYAGIATPSGTPVSGKVFYLTAQAGTYTNYGGLVVPTGINVLKYDGTNWSQEQVISMEDIYRNPLMGYYECDTAGATAAKEVAAAGYVLPTTGGSVKIKMANRNTVANATLNINSTGAKPLFYNGVRAGVGNTWDTNEVVEVYYDGTNYQAHNVAGSSGDGVFDISAYNLTEGQPTSYADLSAALGVDGANVPLQFRKGGMSVKFVQSSDNNYMQFRYLLEYENTTAGNAAFVNTDNWSFCGNDVLIECREFVDVYLDKNKRIVKAVKNDGKEYFAAGIETETLKVLSGSEIYGDMSTDGADFTVIENQEFVSLWMDKEYHILFGVQNDGNFYFGAGVPQQVVDYLQGYDIENIATFLGNLVRGDKTLAELLDGKVDKEEGKSLIDEDVADGMYCVESREYVDVKIDAEKKILEATRNNGTKVFNTDVSFPAATIQSSKNSEYISVELDAEKKILGGRKANGKRFEHLGIESASLPSIMDDDSPAEFNIGDINGNAVIQVKNGHIKTKKFDSSNVFDGIISFLYSINNTPLLEHAYDQSINIETDVNTVITDSKVTMDDGTEVVYPCPGGYPAFWVRDYAMALDSGYSFPAQDILDCYNIIKACVPTSGEKAYWVPDHILKNGQPVWKAGTFEPDPSTAGFGDRASLDGIGFLVKIADKYVQLTNDTQFMEDELPFLLNATKSIMQDYLAYVPLDKRVVVFGFEDSILMNGYVAYASMQAYESMIILKNWAEKIGVQFNEDINAIKTAFNEKFVRNNGYKMFRLNGIHYADTAYVAPSTNIDKDRFDVWQTAYAIRLGILTDENTVKCAAALLYYKDSYIRNGMAKHVPDEFYYSPTSMWQGYNGIGRYQYGGYWSTPMADIISAIKTLSRTTAEEILKDAVEYGHNLNWPECVNEDYSTQNLEYVSSVTYVYCSTKL